MSEEHIEILEERIAWLTRRVLRRDLALGRIEALAAGSRDPVLTCQVNDLVAIVITGDEEDLEPEPAT